MRQAGNAKLRLSELFRINFNGQNPVDEAMIARLQRMKENHQVREEEINADPFKQTFMERARLVTGRRQVKLCAKLQVLTDSRTDITRLNFDYSPAADLATEMPGSLIEETVEFSSDTPCIIEFDLGFLYEKYRRHSPFDAAPSLSDFFHEIEFFEPVREPCTDEAESGLTLDDLQCLDLLLAELNTAVDELPLVDAQGEIIHCA